MKKRILFVIPSLWSGGAEKSLITVLSLFDYDKYDVDLLAFRRDGLFAGKVPKEIRTVFDTTDYEFFDNRIDVSLKYFLKKLKLLTALDRIKYWRLFGIEDDFERIEKIWKILKKRLPAIKEKYDCAIAYTENLACDFVADEVDADYKIGYVHTDLETYEHDKKTFRNRLIKMDRIVTVSEKCKKSLEEEIPELLGKITVIENITSKKLIAEEAKAENVYPERIDGETVILTVGRIVPVKNIGLAAQACAELKRRGRKVRWYHIGTGDLRQTLENQVKELGIENDFIMLGEQPNPYPYMAQCDIYVQPSNLEGKSIAIEEIKCICKPLVVTDFSTAASQVNDGVTGFICKKNKDDMADKIEMLIDSPELCRAFSDAQANENAGNESEIEKLYYLIEKGEK